MDGEQQKTIGDEFENLHKRIQRGGESLHVFFCLQLLRYRAATAFSTTAQLLAPPNRNRQPSFRITGTSLDSSVLGEAQRMRALCSLSDADFLVLAAVYAHEPIIKRLPGAAEPVACQ